MVVEVANYPSISPDGKQIAYHRIKDEGIYIANIDGSNPRRIVGGETCCVQWSPDAKRLVYLLGKLKAGDTKIYVVNVDGTGGVEIAPGFTPSWSPDGTKIVYAGCQPNSTQCGLFIYDLKAKAATLITRDSGGVPQWSPRGDKIVYQADDGKGHVNVFVVNPDSTGRTQLTSGKSNDGQPIWSVDGSHIFWRSDQDGKAWGIFVMRTDGSNARLLINNAPPDVNFWPYESLSAGP
jgi:TolB protein